MIITRNISVIREPTWWLIFFTFLLCVGFGEAQTEEEKHEPVFCVASYQESIEGGISEE